MARQKQTKKSKTKTSSTHVKTTRPIRWSYVLITIALVSLVGGFMVFRSYAANANRVRYVPGSHGISTSPANMKVVTKQNGAGKVWAVPVLSGNSAPQGKPVASFSLAQNTQHGYGSYCIRTSVPSMTQIVADFRGKANLYRASGYSLNGAYAIRGDNATVCTEADLSKGPLHITLLTKGSSPASNKPMIVWEIYKAQRAADCKGTAELGVPTGNSAPNARPNANPVIHKTIRYTWTGTYCKPSIDSGQPPVEPATTSFEVTAEQMKGGILLAGPAHADFVPSRRLSSKDGSEITAPITTAQVAAHGSICAVIPAGEGEVYMYITGTGGKYTRTGSAKKKIDGKATELCLDLNEARQKGVITDDFVAEKVYFSINSIMCAGGCNYEDAQWALIRKLYGKK